MSMFHYSDCACGRLAGACPAHPVQYPTYSVTLLLQCAARHCAHDSKCYPPRNYFTIPGW